MINFVTIEMESRLRCSLSKNNMIFDCLFDKKHFMQSIQFDQIHVEYVFIE